MITLPSILMTPLSAGIKIAQRQQLFLTGLTLTLLLCGCASTSLWKQQSFALTLPSSDQATPAAHTNFLSLRGVTVSPLFEGKAIVYRTSENCYEQDPYAEFLVSPDRMLGECVRLYLREGHAFAAVLEPDSDLHSSCCLAVSINQLYGDFRQTDKPFALLDIHFLLYSTESADYGCVLWQKEFSKRLPLRAEPPPA